MKTTLSIILIIVGAYAYYLQSTVRGLRAELADPEPPAALVKERDDLLEKAAHLEDQLAKAQADLADSLERETALRAAPAPVPQAPRITSAAPVPAPVPGSTAIRNPQSAIRNSPRIAQIDLQLAALRAEQTRGQAARAAAAPPTFEEQRDRVDGAGRVIGKAGIRTSDADRQKALAAYQARLAAMDVRLAEIQAQIQALETERATLNP